MSKNIVEIKLHRKNKTNIYIYLLVVEYIVEHFCFTVNLNKKFINRNNVEMSNNKKLQNFSYIGDFFA